MKKAIQFGAGNIGRGFIGALLADAGYHVVFADVNEAVIDKINEDKSYTVHVMDVECKEKKITNISGVNSTKPEVIDEMQEAEVPTQIKAEDRTPEESIEFAELKEHILESMKKLPRRERELIEYKFFKEKKLREISEEFDISQSRISRIIQAGLDKIKKDLKKQGII